MRLSEFCKQSGISESECRVAIHSDILVDSLDGHLSELPLGEFELDEDAVFILERYFRLYKPSASRSDQNRKGKGISQKAQKFLYIVIVFVIFLYYMAAIILETMGIITKVGMALMIMPVVLVICIAYAIHKYKKKSEEIL